jgi:hypothetical protein
MPRNPDNEPESKRGWISRYAEAIRAFFWRWRRLVFPAAFAICVAATMVLVVERKPYLDALEAFDRIQVGMDWQEADWILTEPIPGNGSKHPERFLGNGRMEHTAVIYRVGDYRLEIVCDPHTGAVSEKRRNPEPWLSLVVVRRHFGWSTKKIQSYLNRYLVATVINATYCCEVLREMAK